MVDNAFVTCEVWSEAIKSFFNVYWHMPVIRDNPQCNILEFLDGFGLYHFEPCALELRTKNHIFFSKE